MIQDFIARQIEAQLPFEATEQQKQLIEALGVFLSSKEPGKLFLLKGYAGTGKTSVVSALVKAMKQLGQKTQLLAPTGRAAKVLSGYSGSPAYTIHKKIYRQKSMAEFRFQLSDNRHRDTLFVVDEASMISNSDGEGSAFGSGRLLDDLIRYVYEAESCSLLLLGDTAQLPPVMQENSPALQTEFLEGYGLSVKEFVLTQVVRQALESGILWHATELRQRIEQGDTFTLPPFNSGNFTDLRRLSGNELIEQMQRSYDKQGVEQCMVVTRSNQRAKFYNNGIRARVMMREEELNNGDLLMVTKNNYFWNKNAPDIDFIANGDIVEVKRIGKYHQIYGFRFVDLTLYSQDYGWEVDARIWLDALQSGSPAEMKQLTDTLFARVEEDYIEIGNRRERIKKILENEFFNALQVKFAYAVTCHKAQGGQWKHVFIDTGRLSDEQVNTEFYRWLYTALTRASEQIFLINYPDEGR